MAAPTTVSTTIRTSTTARAEPASLRSATLTTDFQRGWNGPRAEPRSPYELPGAGIRGPGSGDLISRDCATAQPRGCRRRVSPFPRFPASVSSSISVSAGPGDGDQNVVRCSHGEGGGKIIGHRRVVPDGHAARAAGVLKDDGAVGQDDAVHSEVDGAGALLHINPNGPRRRRLCVAGAWANHSGLQ